MENRREFLKKKGMLTGSVGMASLIPGSIQRAFAIDPAPGTTWKDAEHIVILMQENRSFDHCFGTLRGVRGFNDPRAIQLVNGNPVWLQSDDKGNTYAPFHLDLRDTKATWMNSLPHTWDNQVNAYNEGKHDRWLEEKRSSHPEYRDMPLTMGYHNRDDIPFNYALADAFTVCDQHFCSSLTGTIPNRLFFWTGTIRDHSDEASRALVWNDDADYESLNWTTFPERLEETGVSWKVYQNELSVEVGFEGEEESWLSNFGDNPLEFFSQYNIRFHPRHLEAWRIQGEVLPDKIDGMKKTLAGLPPGDPGIEKLDKKIAEATKKLAEARLILASKTGKWEQLNQKEKSLHLKGFAVNSKDPDYHKLETLSYRSGSEDRTFVAPKGDLLHQFREDVNNGSLPTVSWLVAPENFSDHPASAWYGSLYVSEAMDILTKDPGVWKKTIFLLTYDENDGYYDHVPPFVAPHPHKRGTGKVSEGIDTRTEFVTRTQELERAGFPKPYERESSVGLGFRVPLVIASPWSRGGFVNSEVFDHTSTLQFLEKFIAARTGKSVLESNISDWRRTVCGDLTSVFRPHNGEPMSALQFLDRGRFLESVHQAKFRSVPDNYKRFSTAEQELFRGDPYASPFMAQQEKGIKPACALPYELGAEGSLDHDRANFTLQLSAGNRIFGTKAAGSPFKVYAPGPYTAGADDATVYSREWSYAVKAGDSLSDQWPLTAFAEKKYHLLVYGPNGFFREFTGGTDDPELDVRFEPESAGGRPTGSAVLLLTNHSSKPLSVLIRDNAYRRKPLTKMIPPRTKSSVPADLSRQHGWYDLSISVSGTEGFLKRYAGRVETGRDSITDPYMGRTV